MKVKRKDQGDLSLPDFLVVGAAKSATTSLYHYLGQHPEIRMTTIKESWFFSFVDNPPSYTSPGVFDVVSRLDDYVKLFEGAGQGQMLGDASPSYLYTYRDTIRNIQSIYPPDALKNLRIIISLRDPVNRAFSQYWTLKRWVEEPLAFEEAVEESTIKNRLNNNWSIFYDYIGFGLYYEQVKAFLDVFGEDRVLILLFDDIRKNPVGVCQSVYSFLGVDPDFVPNVGIKHNEVTGEPSIKWIVRALISRNPIKRAVAACLPKGIRNLIKYIIIKSMLKRGEMDKATRLKLLHTYSEDIKRLERLINRDLSRWRSDV